jgi:phosphoglycolate phosphatase-like HAD superfamily hydrolase
MEPACENVEDKFPPWKYEVDQKACKTLSNPIPAPNGTHSAGQRFADDLKEQELAPTFENTVIIFDWDDTLLCSSALHCCLPNQFHELEEVVEALLLMSMKLGRTMIVTNAMESWIQETAQRFMPRLLPTLERLLIVYARKNYERNWPGDTFAWKRETFRELLHDKFGRYLNLLVVGDSLSEIRAAENVAESLSTSAVVKTVKFKAMPSPSDLLGELRTFGPQLGTLVEARYSATKEFRQDFSAPQRSQNWFLLDAVPLDHETPPPGIYQQAPVWSAMHPTNQITTI